MTSSEIKVPKLSDYEMRFMDIVYQPIKDSEPCRFHRVMMRIFFGMKWSKVK
jgi:hypothetical protein